MKLIDADDLLNSVDAAAYLGLSTQRLHVLRTEGRLGQLIAGIWLYSKTELDEYRVTSKGKKGRPRKNILSKEKNG